MVRRLLRHYKRTVRFVEILLVLFALLFAYNFFLPLGTSYKTLYFDVNDTESVLKALKAADYDVMRFDSFLLTPGFSPKRGWYTLPDTASGRYFFFRHLFDTPAPTRRIRIYAGETADDTIKRLSHDTKLPLEALKNAYRKLSRFKEGDLIAAYYNISHKADADTLMRYLFYRSDRLRHAFMTTYFIPPLNDRLYKALLTIASIVQKETHRKEEMPLVASIIYNRLTKGMKLQMDGTLNYGCYAHIPVTPERIRDDNTTYNTYKYKGLPPAPLSNVSVAALKAAMFPAKTDYLFMMLQPDGTHHFSSTYEEHLRYLKKFKTFLKQRKKRSDKQTVHPPQHPQKQKKQHINEQKTKPSQTKADL